MVISSITSFRVFIVIAILVLFIQYHNASALSNTNKPGAAAATFPKDVKEAVSKCRQATQDALSNRSSRMEVCFPVGTDFGVEKKTDKPKKRGRLQDDYDGSSNSNNNRGTPTQAILEKSDRELARLFVEMFQPVGGDNIAVTFIDDNLADDAKLKWKTEAGGASCRILAMNRRKSLKKKKTKKKSGAKGFAAKLDIEIGSDSDDDTPTADDGSSKGGPFQLPSNTEVALFVAPGPKELIVIEKICDTVGMGTLVVLLNARLDKVTKYGTKEAEKLFTEDFETVFNLGAASQEDAPNCLLYHAYPGDWVLARKPNIGRPKTILCQTSKPTNLDCQQAFETLEISDLEKNVENFVDNVAGWFS